MLFKKKTSHRCPNCKDFLYKAGKVRIKRKNGRMGKVQVYHCKLCRRIETR